MIQHMLARLVLVNNRVPPVSRPPQCAGQRTDPPEVHERHGREALAGTVGCDGPTRDGKFGGFARLEGLRGLGAHRGGAGLEVGRDGDRGVDDAHGGVVPVVPAAGDLAVLDRDPPVGHGVACSCPGGLARQGHHGGNLSSSTSMLCSRR